MTVMMKMMMMMMLMETTRISKQGEQEQTGHVAEKPEQGHTDLTTTISTTHWNLKKKEKEMREKNAQAHWTDQRKNLRRKERTEKKRKKREKKEKTPVHQVLSK